MIFFMVVLLTIAMWVEPHTLTMVVGAGEDQRLVDLDDDRHDVEAREAVLLVRRRTGRPRRRRRARAGREARWTCGGRARRALRTPGASNVRPPASVLSTGLTAVRKPARLKKNGSERRPANTLILPSALSCRGRAGSPLT